MCGISGFAGKSKDPELTYELITALFHEIEVRGTDAAGFWGTSVDDIYYHKEPIKSSKLVKKSVWTDLKDINFDLLLVHSRGASLGVGSPIHNKNNHPFTNHNRHVGMIHNGRIDHNEYISLQGSYELFSDCDSEIILRIFENSEDFYQEFQDEEQHIANRLSGIKNIWSHLSNSQMAVAIGEKLEDGSKILWLFRNPYRSLWIIDLRDLLGQIFFCSTLNIWKHAVLNCPKLSNQNIKLIEFPTEEIWRFEIQQDGTLPDNFLSKYAVNYSEQSSALKTKQKFSLKPLVSHDNVITYLNDREELDDYDECESYCDVQFDEGSFIVNEYSIETKQISKKDISDSMLSLEYNCERIIQNLNDLENSLDEPNTFTLNDIHKFIEDAINTTDEIYMKLEEF